MDLGQFEEALKHYDIAIKKDSLNPNYYFNRGIVKTKLDKLKEATEDFVRSLDNHPDANTAYLVYFHKGVTERKLGNLTESIDDFKQAILQKAEKAATYNNLGLSYYEKEDFENALAQFTKSIEIEQHSFHYNNRGLAQYNLGKLEEAKKDYDMAIKLNPDDAFYYYNRGNVYLNQGDYTQAHEDYDQAIELSPNTAKFWHSKGLAFEGNAFRVNPKKGDRELIDRAIEMYEQALEIADNFISSRFHLGLMHHKIQSYQKALQCFSIVLEKLPDDKTVYIARGLVYQDMGNH